MGARLTKRASLSTTRSTANPQRGRPSAAGAEAVQVGLPFGLSRRQNPFSVPKRARSDLSTRRDGPIAPETRRCRVTASVIRNRCVAPWSDNYAQPRTFHLSKGELESSSTTQRKTRSPSATLLPRGRPEPLRRPVSQAGQLSEPAGSQKSLRRRARLAGSDGDGLERRRALSECQDRPGSHYVRLVRRKSLPGFARLVPDERAVGGATVDDDYVPAARA